MKCPYVITAEMNLETLIAETKEVAQALNELSENLEQIQRKYANKKEENEEGKNDNGGIQA